MRTWRRGVVLAFVLGLIGCVSAVAASADWTWWPAPASRTGLAVYLSYSNDFQTYQGHAAADQLASAIHQAGIDVVFVQISSKKGAGGAPTDLQKLSDRSSAFTADLRYFLSKLAAQQVSACAGVFSTAVNGADPELALPDVSLIDNVVSFNTAVDPGGAGFGCVVTDVEFSRPSVNHPLAASLARWKQFHQQLRARLQADASSMALVAYIQGPDSLIDKMDANDRPAFLQQHGIQADATHPGLFDGAITYFATQDGTPLVDAIAPMWYVSSVDDYTALVDHSTAELQGLGAGAPSLIAGIKVSMQDSQGASCTSDCLQTPTDYASVLGSNDLLRMANSSFIGTAVYKWPFAPGWNAAAQQSVIAPTPEADDAD